MKMRQKGKGYKRVKVRWQRGPSVAISVIFSYMCCAFLRARGVICIQTEVG